MLRACSPGLNFGVLDTILQKNFVWSIQNETPDQACYSAPNK